MKKNFSKVKVNFKALIFIVVILIVFIFGILQIGELLGWQSKGIDESRQLAKTIATDGGGADDEEDPKSYEVARASCANGSTNYCDGGCCVSGETCADPPLSGNGVCSPSSSQCQQGEFLCVATGTGDRRINQCCPNGNTCETVTINVPASSNDVNVARCRPPAPREGCPSARLCGSVSQLCCPSGTTCATRIERGTEIAGCFPSSQTSCTSGWTFCRGTGDAANVSRCCQYGCGPARENGMPGACNQPPTSGQIKPA